MVDKDDLRNRFTYHPGSSERAAKHITIREAGLTLAEFVNDMVPEGREKALALTKIEEAIHWANAGLARSPE